MTISHPLLATALAAALSTTALFNPAQFDSAQFDPVPPLPPLPEIVGQHPPAQEGPLAPATADVPADLLDLSDWKLTLPTGDESSPQEVLTGALSTFTNEFFRVNESRNGVVFTAKVGGVTTQNSKYPRSELREMRDGEKASWSNPGGTHTLEVREAIIATPKAKPEVVAAQIHDGDDDVLQIRLEGERLTVQSDDGETETVLDPAYRLGTPYDLRIVAADGRVEVFHDGEKKAELNKSGTGWYFKVGAYVQSSTEKGDAVGTPGAVAVYALKVTHTD
ncbi:polysaccharide lyase family 7 protein [Pseudonocardia zijingensis]|jgi:hypothetical protein|uniref:Polysaccharide lyase family 7 protein n=1 Tax=Pseudonocardia zijingensis TaxID=153376 RepID=A0ABP3YXF5_9PSEU